MVASIKRGRSKLVIYIFAIIITLEILALVLLNSNLVEKKDYQLSPLSASQNIPLLNPVSGTNPVFWSEYNSSLFSHDPNVYALFDFDTSSPSYPSYGNFTNVASSDALIEPNGRFKSALKLQGRGYVNFLPKNPLDKNDLALDAWIKLDRYPASGKRAYIFFKAPLVDNNPLYNEVNDKSNGFSLWIDENGRIIFTVTNTFYGYTTNCTTLPATVPLGEWFHIGAIVDETKRIYINGRLVQRTLHYNYGSWLGSETQPSNIYIGNNDQRTGDFSGLIDQARIHKTLYKFWENNISYLGNIPYPQNKEPFPLPSQEDSQAGTDLSQGHRARIHGGPKRLRKACTIR